MTDPSEFGDADEVFRKFAARLVRLARSHLDVRLQSKVDPDDVLQSVLRSFFVRQEAGQFELESWDDLWALLATITVRKCRRQMARFRAQRRSISRESAGEPDWLITDALNRAPTPLEAVTLTELMEQLMSGLEARDREILTLRLRGYKIHEISQQVSRTERTVQRVLAQIRRDTEALLDEG